MDQSVGEGEREKEREREGEREREREGERGRERERKVRGGRQTGGRRSINSKFSAKRRKFISYTLVTELYS